MSEYPWMYKPCGESSESDCLLELFFFLRFLLLLLWFLDLERESPLSLSECSFSRLEPIYKKVLKLTPCTHVTHEVLTVYIVYTCTYMYMYMYVDCGICICECMKGYIAHTLYMYIHVLQIITQHNTHVYTCICIC